MCLKPFAISKNQFMPLRVVKLDFATFEIFSCVYGSNLDVINFLRSHILTYAHAHSHNTLTQHPHTTYTHAVVGRSIGLHVPTSEGGALFDCAPIRDFYVSPLSFTVQFTTGTYDRYSTAMHGWQYFSCHY